MGISMGPDGGKEKMSDKEKIVKLGHIVTGKQIGRAHV